MAKRSSENPNCGRTKLSGILRAVHMHGIVALLSCCSAAVHAQDSSSGAFNDDGATSAWSGGPFPPLAWQVVTKRCSVRD